VALFEAVFGSQQLAINALLPLSVGLVAFFAALVVLLFIRRRPR